MKTPVRIWAPMLLLGLGGAALFITLLVQHGLADIGAAVAKAGWGIVAVMAFHFVPLAFDALGWWAVIPPEQPRPLRSLFVLRWIGDAVSAMLPVAQVGGEIVRVRLAAAPGSRRAMPLSIAAASVLVALTVNVATQIVFVLSGLAMLVLATEHSSITGPVLLGTLLGVAAIGGFYAVQRIGIFRILGKLISGITRSEQWKGLVAQGAAVDEHVRALYGRRGGIIGSAVWNLCSWATGAVEVWIALWALGVPASYAHAFILESMSQGIRSAAFLVPAALGVQEEGYLLIGGLLGIPADAALALSLIRRARDLAFGIPGLLAWQWHEGRRLFHRRAAVSQDAEKDAMRTGA